MTVTAGRWLAFLFAMAGMSTAAMGAEIQSLAWEPGSETPVLQVRMSGEGVYTTQVLEDGQRLRISFPDSSMGPALAEIQGLDKVKGVYPYLADNGTAVVVDLLMNEPGQLDVQKAEYGYRVVASTATPPSSAAVAPAAWWPWHRRSMSPLAEQTAAAPVADDKNSIEDIVYAKLPGDRIQITFKMTKTARGAERLHHHQSGAYLAGFSEHPGRT